MTDQRAPKPTREGLLKADVQALMADRRFLRVVFCILMDANVLRGGYGADTRNFAFWEGRRSLGLDILAVLQGVDPDAMLTILSEETKTRMETSSGRRTSPDRRDELGDLDGRVRTDGARFLDYGGE